MSKSLRLPFALVGLTAVAAGAVVAGPATAQSGKSTAKVIIRGGPVVVPGKEIRDTQRFTPLSSTIAPGGTLTVVNAARSKDPHTISFVKRSQLPKTAAGMEKCSGPSGACGKLFVAHEASEDGPPAKPVVDVGRTGIDQPGDSVVLMGRTTKLKISAARGTTLHYLCAIHPWMQGTIKVR